MDVKKKRQGWNQVPLVPFEQTVGDKKPKPKKKEVVNVERQRRELMAEARAAAKWRQHELTPFELFRDGELATATCRRCGKIVTVCVAPRSNETPIMGLAIAEECNG